MGSFLRLVDEFTDGVEILRIRLFPLRTTLIALGIIISFWGIYKIILQEKERKEKIQRKYNLFQTLMDNIPDSIYFKDRKNRFVEVNKVKAEHYRTTPEEMKGKTDFDFLPEKEAKECFVDDNWVMKSGKPIMNKVERITHRNGTKYWVSVTKIPWYDEKREIMGTMGISRNITQQRKIEEKYTFLFDNSPDLIAQVDGQGRFIMANRSMAYSLGRRKEEIVGKSFFELMPEEVARKRLEIGRKVIREKKMEVVEDSRAGRYFHNIFIPVPEEKSFYIIARDVTMLKKVENKLRESEEKYRAVTENSPLGIYVFQEGKFIFVNKSMESLSGYKREELLSMDYLQLIHPDYREMVEKMTKQALKGNTQNLPSPLRFKALRKNGEEIWVENTPSVINYRGKIAILGSIKDVTEVVQLEEKVKNLCSFYREIGRAVNWSKNLSEFSRRILEALRGVIDYGMGSLWIYYPQQELLINSARIGYPEDLEKKIVKEQRVKEGEVKVEVYCVLTKKAIYIKDMKKHEFTEYMRKLCQEYDLFQMYALPLIAKEELEGVLEIMVKSDKILSKGDRKFLDGVTEEVAGGLRKIKVEAELQELVRKDSLTGLYNYRHFCQKIEEQKSRKKRYGEIYSLLYIDVDGFKSINDTYGHQEGDKVLQKLAKILQDYLRKADSAYRYGGEEFVILLPYTSKEQAQGVAERIREKVYHSFYPHYRITVSIGVVDSREGDKDIVGRADEAMYRAKRKGKNRVEVG